MAEITDRELLELAAKAAGYKFDSTDPFEIAEEHKAGTNWIEWNPLADDGDALRLAVKLAMSVEISEHEDSTYAYAGPSPRVYGYEMWKGDKYGATRRAITRAAAEIGKAIT